MFSSLRCLSNGKGTFCLRLRFTNQFFFFSKASLVVLFALSLILVAITLYRVIEVIDHRYDQRFRSLIASLEILAAAAVANALVLGSFVRDRGAKKQRYRHHVGTPSAHSSQEQRPVARRHITQQNWGSDADLAGELGISCTRELREKEADTSRPAPVALPLEKDAKNLTPMPRHMSVSDEPPQITIDLADGLPSLPQQPSDIPHTPTKAAFFDIGGLLNDGDTIPRPRQQSITGSQVQNFSRPISPSTTSPGRSARPSFTRKGSDTFLEDVGALLSIDEASLGDRPSSTQRGMSLVDVLRETGPQDAAPVRKPRAPQRGVTAEIQDPGGLLK